MISNPVREHRAAKRALASALDRTHIYWWLVDRGYYPECYVLPPSFQVARRPSRPKLYFRVPKSPTKKSKYSVDRTECVPVHFPRTELTDRVFGIMDPYVHNDIAFHFARHWDRVVAALFPHDSDVTSYSFPLPIDSRNPGRLGSLRSGWLIYQFLEMIDDDLAAIAYRYRYIVRTDIKRFYPSIYTHSLAWALDGKAVARAPANVNDYRRVGNRLDRLFQYANDRCTNGIPIGPVVSDLAAELVATAVDRELTRLVRADGIECEIVRFKDDYRILVQNQSDAHTVIKYLQAALLEYKLEINESKTTVHELPDGFFRSWRSRYHALLPRRPRRFSWNHFRETYLGVLAIDEELPGTGVIDRFLSDLVTKSNQLRLELDPPKLQRSLSMLLMLGQRRAKVLPKVIAIIEAVLRTPFGAQHTNDIVSYLEEYLHSLAKDEPRHKYVIAWIGYFLKSNRLTLSVRPSTSDIITRTVFANRSLLFSNRKDFTLYKGAISAGRSTSMLEHLDLFDPPELVGNP